MGFITSPVVERPDAPNITNTRQALDLAYNKIKRIDEMFICNDYTAEVTLPTVKGWYQLAVIEEPTDVFAMNAFLSISCRCEQHTTSLRTDAMIASGGMYKLGRCEWADYGLSDGDTVSRLISDVRITRQGIGNSNNYNEFFLDDNGDLVVSSDSQPFATLEVLYTNVIPLPATINVDIRGTGKWMLVYPEAVFRNDGEYPPPPGIEPPRFSFSIEEGTEAWDKLTEKEQEKYRERVQAWEAYWEANPGTKWIPGPDDRIKDSEECDNND